MPSPRPVYESRIVVFLDFLGFRDHIERTVIDPTHVRKVAHAIDTVREFTQKDSESMSQQVTQFSDCVVISYAAVQPSAVFNLLLDIAMLQVELASQGFLIRGRVTAGDLLHQPDMVFGPALVEAYRIENSVALDPRVVVDRALVNIARANPAPHHDGVTEKRYVDGFLEVDADGHSYIDYISWEAVVEGVGAESDDYPGYMVAIARILKLGFQSSEASVLRKMLWLHARYDAAIRHFLEPPRDPEVIARHSDFYEALIELPQFATELANATQKVKSPARRPPNFE